MIALEACKGPQAPAGALEGFKASGAFKALEGLQGPLKAIDSLKNHRGPLPHRPLRAPKVLEGLQAFSAFQGIQGHLIEGPKGH